MLEDCTFILLFRSREQYCIATSIHYHPTLLRLFSTYTHIYTPNQSIL